MNFLRAADLRVGDVVHIPNHIGQWSQVTDKITLIINGDLSGMLTLHLEKGLSFRVHPNGQVPFVNVAQPYNVKKETPVNTTVKDPKIIREALVGIYTLSELQLLNRSLNKQLNDLVDEKKSRPSRTIEALEEFERKFDEWLKVSNTISAAIIYLENDKLEDITKNPQKQGANS